MRKKKKKLPQVSETIKAISLVQSIIALDANQNSRSSFMPNLLKRFPDWDNKRSLLLFTWSRTERRAIGKPKIEKEIKVGRDYKSD